LANDHGDFNVKVWERIQQDQIRSRQHDLDRLMARVREIAREHGAEVFPFGSYAGGRVDATSDLDVACPGELSRAQQLRIIRDVEIASVIAGIEVDLVFEAETPDFFREVCDGNRVH